MEEKWMSLEMAVDKKMVSRAFGLSDWAIRFGQHAVNEELQLIKLP